MTHFAPASVRLDVERHPRKVVSVYFVAVNTRKEIAYVELREFDLSAEQVEQSGHETAVLLVGHYVDFETDIHIVTAPYHRRTVPAIYCICGQSHISEPLRQFA